MKIITCIKQVPASSKVNVDPITGVLIREGNNVKMNPYDLYALETAYQIKERFDNVQIHSITMGPHSAKKVLEEALYMGSDHATLLTDRVFAGADVLATSYTISQLIQTLGDFDIVICGKQTTDGDTAQVGPEIAEFLNVPHATYIKEIIEIKNNILTVKATYDEYDEIIEMEMPCLITVEKGFSVPRLPSYKRKMSLKDEVIQTVTFKNLKDQDPNHYGLKGSPTQVDEIFPPAKNNLSQLVEGTSKEVADKLFKMLKDGRYL